MCAISSVAPAGVTSSESLWISCASSAASWPLAPGIGAHIPKEWQKPMPIIGRRSVVRIKCADENETFARAHGPTLQSPLLDSPRTPCLLDKVRPTFGLPDLARLCLGERIRARELRRPHTFRSPLGLVHQTWCDWPLPCRLSPLRSTPMRQSGSSLRSVTSHQPGRHEKQMANATQPRHQKLQGSRRFAGRRASCGNCADPNRLRPLRAAGRRRSSASRSERNAAYPLARSA